MLDWQAWAEHPIDRRCNLPRSWEFWQGDLVCVALFHLLQVVSDLEENIESRGEVLPFSSTGAFSP